MISRLPWPIQRAYYNCQVWKKAGLAGADGGSLWQDRPLPLNTVVVNIIEIAAGTTITRVRLFRYLQTLIVCHVFSIDFVSWAAFDYGKNIAVRLSQGMMAIYSGYES
jgi:hypothetical protein